MNHMLNIDFFNVGDGDSILLLEQRRDSPGFAALIDTGRPSVEFVKGSQRREAIAHLMKASVERIDLMVLTHLHFDHIGGALRILQRIPVGRLVLGYLPPEGARWIVPPSFEEKTVVGLCEALNMLADILSVARRSGCRCEIASPGARQLTAGLKMETAIADTELLSRQKQVYDALYLGGDPGYDEMYRVSKDRNNSSIVTRFGYAGREILLTGDSYASYLEGRVEARCDILKLPHHGDEKSMNATLLEKLAPEYAVISCQNTDSDKDRPTVPVLDMLCRKNIQVFCTENRELPGYSAGTQESVRFCIHDDGRIDCLGKKSTSWQKTC